MRSLVMMFAGLFAGCASPSLAEQLDEPDVAITGNCAGSTEIQVAGTIVDLVTGVPVPGASVDLTEAWTASRSFPADGCRIGTATTDAAGRFGPVSVRASDSDPVIVMLVTGAGRAPTIADRSVSCVFGCGSVDERIEAPSLDLATRWREELYAGGMEYALNRGLVAYTFVESDKAPSPDVVPAHRSDNFLDTEDAGPLHPGSELRFLDADRETLASPDQSSTTSSGQALIGRAGDSRGYFRVEGTRGTSRWPSVGVIVATGWIYVESGHIE